MYSDQKAGNLQSRLGEIAQDSTSGAVVTKSRFAGRLGVAGLNGGGAIGKR